MEFSGTLQFFADHRMAGADESAPEQLCHDRRKGMAPQPGKWRLLCREERKSHGSEEKERAPRLSGLNEPWIFRFSSE